MLAAVCTERQEFRSVFISDVHLGSRPCRAEALRDFLRGIRCEQLFLVGDIVDLWSLKRRFHWPAAHTEVLRTVLERIHEGTRVVYVPGNHDHAFRAMSGSVFGGIEIHREYLHTAADGRRFLVMHGDEFDGIVHCHPALARLGAQLYDLLVAINPAVDAVRAWFGQPPYSLAATLAQATPRARRYLQNYQEAALATARRRGVDGIVCGHIHHAARRMLGPLLYCNTGDWVGSCTALTESRDGTLALLQWASQPERPGIRGALPARAA
jgi:UDP-2,3-diacylglucosamine pyrophosphatase LpxH